LFWLFLLFYLFVSFIWFYFAFEPTHGKMRRNQLIQEEIHRTMQSFHHLLGPNEWLNFSEMAQRIRLSETLAESNVRTAVSLLEEHDGIIREKRGEIDTKLIYGGFVLETAC